MSHLDTVSQWGSTVSAHLPHLKPPQAHVQALWNCGIEGGKNVTKRGGWQWHLTKTTDLARASRLWQEVA